MAKEKNRLLIAKLLMTISVNPSNFLLVIEDDFLIRKNLVELLNDEGFHAEGVENGLQALRR